MKRWVLAVFFVLAGALPAYAQVDHALVVSTCGTLPTGTVFPPGVPQPMTQDINGLGCSSAVFSGSISVGTVGQGAKGSDAAADSWYVQPGTGASFPVTGTFWQATQPVSGTVATTQSTSPWVVSGTVTANAGTNLNTSALALDATVGTTNTDLGPPGATACATDTGSCSINALAQRLAQRLTTVNTTLGSPFQAGGSIGNTTFAATQGTSPWVVSGTTTAGSTQASAAARGGSITAGGTSQTLISSNGSRKAFTVVNPCSAAEQGIAAAENAYLNLTSAATVSTSANLAVLAPCSSFSMGLTAGIVSTEAVTAIAATTGHQLYAKEF